MEMTNEEAVVILKNAIKKPNTEDGYLGQALSMAIKALEATNICWIVGKNGEQLAFKNMPIDKAEKILAIVEDKAPEQQRNITNEELYQENIRLEAENERLHDALEQQSFKGKINGDIIETAFGMSLSDFQKMWGGGEITEDWWKAPYKKR